MVGRSYPFGRGSSMGNRVALSNACKTKIAWASILMSILFKGLALRARDDLDTVSQIEWPYLVATGVPCTSKELTHCVCILHIGYLDRCLLVTYRRIISVGGT